MHANVTTLYSLYKLNRNQQYDTDMVINNHYDTSKRMMSKSEGSNTMLVLYRPEETDDEPIDGMEPAET